MDLLNAVLQSPQRNSCLGHVLLDCAEHQSFLKTDSSELQSVVAQINSNLNEHNSRFCGILILRTFLTQCPDEIFSNNAFSWVSQILRVVNDTSQLTDESEIGLALLVLRDIIVASSQFPELNKQLITLFPKLLTTLTSGVYKDCEESLLCLQSCMKYYSGQCLSFKAAIFKLLLNELASNSASVIEAAAECFSLLPLLGGSNGIKEVSIINGINQNYSGEWNVLLSKIIRTLHVILNNLLAGINEVKNYSELVDVLPIPSESDNFSVVLKQNLTMKFTSLSRYLCLMLQNPFPAAKIIAVEELMGLICRALAVTCNSLKDKISSEFIILSARLPDIHCACFSILSALIACSRLHLLPYGSLIVKLVLQSLKWTSSSKEWPSSIRKPYTSLRCSAYHCISMWLRVSASASCVEDVAEELIESALLDMVHSRQNVKLVSDNIGNKHQRKHEKRKSSASKPSNDDNSTKSLASGMKCAVGDGSANSEVCCAALEMLSSLLQSVGAFLKPIEHKLLQETTTMILIDIQRSGGTISSKQSSNKDILTSLIMPYQSDAKCYLCLLKLLLALVLEPHSHKWASPLGLASHIFCTGQNDSNIEVATFCSTAKRAVERLMHPMAPSLNFPITKPMLTGITPDENNIENFHSEVSNRTNSSFGCTVGTQTDKASEKDAVAQDASKIRNLVNVNHKYTDTSDLIVLSGDDGKIPLQTVTISQDSDSKSCFSSTEGEKNVSFPLALLKNKGIQYTGNPLLDDKGDSADSPPWMAVKVPIEKRSFVKMLDFTQQFCADFNNGMEPIEVNSDCEDDPVVVNHDDLSKNSTNQVQLGTVVSGSESDDITEVMILDDEPSPVSQVNDEISEVEEMLNCFVDVSAQDE